MGTSGSRWRLGGHRQPRKLAAKAPLRPAAHEKSQFVVFSASRNSITDRVSLEPSLMSPGLSRGNANWKNPGYTVVLTKA
jgi:hypothetical protein